MNIHTPHKILIEEETQKIESELKTIARPDASRPGEWVATREPLDTDKADELETAEDLEEFEGHESMVVKLQQRLHELRHALGAIESGTYGTCEVCKKPIEAARLSANPAATTCVSHMK